MVFTRIRLQLKPCVEVNKQPSLVPKKIPPPLAKNAVGSSQSGALSLEDRTGAHRREDARVALARNLAMNPQTPSDEVLVQQQADSIKDARAWQALPTSNAKEKAPLLVVIGLPLVTGADRDTGARLAVWKDQSMDGFM